MSARRIKILRTFAHLQLGKVTVAAFLAVVVGLLTLQMGGWLLAFVAAAAAADAITGRVARHAAPWAAGLGLALFMALVAWPDLLPWAELPRALPPAVAIVTFEPSFFSASSNWPKSLNGAFGLAAIAVRLATAKNRCQSLMPVSKRPSTR